MPEEKTLNLRSPEVLFDIFTKEFPKFNLRWGNWTEWTSKLLGFFTKLGEQYGYDDIRGGKKTREYLVDLCWIGRLKGHGAAWIELALEEELSYYDIGSITEDFEKIVDLKAYTKVGIFAPKLAEREEALRSLESIVTYSEPKIPTERYLVIFILDHGKKEKKAQRIEIAGYEMNCLGDSKLIKSVRFTG
jgi:hypothetical protein